MLVTLHPYLCPPPSRGRILKTASGRPPRLSRLVGQGRLGSRHGFRKSLASCLLLILCSSQLLAAATTSVRITQSTVGPDALPYWAAFEHGFFRKHGIDVEIIYVRSGANQAAGLVSGGVQFANLGGAPVIATAPRGANLKFIA